MILPILAAFTTGLFVILSRQINGRLALSTSALISSFWNHAVGFVFLSVLAIFVSGVIPADLFEYPWWLAAGGALGVVFVASGSWLITRIGAVTTTILVIAGQMVFGVIFDLLRGQPVTLWACALGVALIVAGTTLTQRRG